MDLDCLRRVLDKKVFCKHVWTRQETPTQLQGAPETTARGSFDAPCGRRCVVWRCGRITFTPRLATKTHQSCLNRDINRS